MEIGAIQMQMVRRGQEQRSLRERIGKLEAELGLAAPAPAAAAK
jgi:BMFP domain-containing protein YqiC